VYESLFLNFMRVSPQGDRVALLEWTEPGKGDVIVVDRSGKKTTLSRGWVGLFGLAWSPKGDEVWFTATRPCSRGRLPSAPCPFRERSAS
jgi:sugar lactone lactonase YvrE